MRATLLSVIVYGLFGILFASAQQPEKKEILKPDLIVDRSKSKIEFKSCKNDEPLVTGHIILLNNGDAAANLRGPDIFRTFIAIYVPEHIDIIQKDTRTSKMEPLESRRVEVSAGKGIVKTGRNYNGFNLPAGYPNNLEDMTIKQMKQVQGLLKQAGYTVNETGVFDNQTKAALKKFKESKRFAPDAVWDKDAASELSAQYQKSTNKDASQTTKITIFVVVDPYNLLDEKDETNNLEKWEIEATGCDVAAASQTASR